MFNLIESKDGTQLVDDTTGVRIWTLADNGELNCGHAMGAYITIEELEYVIAWAKSKIIYQVTFTIDHEPSDEEAFIIGESDRDVTIQRRRA